MSYIFIDAEAARGCAAVISDKAARLRGVIEEAGEVDPRVLDFCGRLGALAEDLSRVTEAYAAEDERLKSVHLLNNEGGRLHHEQ